MPERILIVDDDEGLRDSLQLVFSAEGYEAVGACDAKSALSLIDRAPFDVVLCDLRMPGMDGMELLPQLHRRLPGATLVLMSAYEDRQYALAAVKAGAAAYLAKSDSQAALVDAVLAAGAPAAAEL